MTRTRLRCTSLLSPRITAAAQRADGLAVLLLVVADGAHDLGVLVRAHAEALQDVAAEERRPDPVVQVVDAVADVVEIPGDGGEFGRPLRVAEAQEHVPGDLGDQGAVTRPDARCSRARRGSRPPCARTPGPRGRRARAPASPAGGASCASLLSAHVLAVAHLPHLEVVQGLIGRGVRDREPRDARRRRPDAAPVEHGVDGVGRALQAQGTRSRRSRSCTQPRRPRSAPSRRALAR